MKKNIITLIVFLLSIISCQKRECIIADNFIEKLSEGNYKSTSLYGYIPVFVLTDGGEVIETNSANLSYIYEHHYSKSFKKFSSFLKEILNQKIKISKSNFAGVPYESFVIDANIEKIYKNNNFNSFFKEFVKIPNLKNDRYLLKIKNLDKSQIMSISYFLYLKGYHVKIDDLRAECYVLKREELFNK